MLPENAAPGDNPGKLQDIVTRRMRKGQCFSTPYFGCREFPAHFKQWEGGPIPTIDETRDLGFMLYDFDYSDPQNITPLYFRAKWSTVSFRWPAARCSDDPASLSSVLRSAPCPR